MTDLEKILTTIDLQDLLKTIEFTEEIYKKYEALNKDDSFYRHGIVALSTITNAGSYQRLQKLNKDGKL